MWTNDFLTQYEELDQMILQLTYEPERIKRLRTSCTHTQVVEAYIAKIIQEHE